MFYHVKRASEFQLGAEDANGAPLEVGHQSIHSLTDSHRPLATIHGGLCENAFMVPHDAPTRGCVGGGDDWRDCVARSCIDEGDWLGWVSESLDANPDHDIVSSCRLRTHRSHFGHGDPRETVRAIGQPRMEDSGKSKDRLRAQHLAYWKVLPSAELISELESHLRCAFHGQQL